MAHEFPECYLTGVDVSPVQPSEIRPKNCEFMHKDVTSGLGLGTCSTDYLHQRFLGLYLKPESLVNVMREYHRVLRFDGLLEIHESCFSLDEAGQSMTGEAGQQVVGWMRSVMESFGIDPMATTSLQSLTDAAVICEFKVLETRELQVPSPEQTSGGIRGLGIQCWVDVVQGLEPHIISSQDITVEEFYKVLAAWKKELEASNATWKVHVLIAQKTYS